MAKYMNLGMKKPYSSGNSKALAIPEMVVKQTGFELGDEVEVLYNGGSDMLVRFKKK